MEARDFDGEAGDVGDGEQADEEDRHEGDEGDDLVWCLVVFGLCFLLVLSSKYHGT